MLLQALTVKNAQGSLLGLPLDDISGGFVVKEIQGLGPVKATLVTSSFANLDGEQYHSSRLDPRNIILKLDLEPDYSQGSVYDLRAQLYKFFMPKTRVTLTFAMFDKFSPTVVDQELDLEIMGRIETFDANLFSSKPSVDISIMCYNPAFVDPRVIKFEGSTVNDLTEEELTYKGTLETGATFRIFPDRTVDEFTIYHRPPDGSLRITQYTQQLLAWDELTIESMVGAKHVTLKRNDVESSRLFSLSPQSAWLELQPGDSSFRVYASGAPVPYEIEYTEKYGGL
jgi:hypothetical protein